MVASLPFTLKSKPLRKMRLGPLTLRSPRSLTVSALMTCMSTCVRRLTILLSDTLRSISRKAVRMSLPLVPARPNSAPFSRVR